MANNLRALREAKGFTQEGLAAKMGTTRSQLIKLERGERQLTPKWIERAAGALDVSLGALIEEGGASTSVRAAIPKAPQTTAIPTPQPDASYPMPLEFPRRRLPVFGHAAGGLEQDGKFILNGMKVADVLCPPELEHVKDAFAVYMHGDSMRPAFRPGDTLYIDPSRPVAAGDEVLVQIKGAEDEPPYGFVKEFMRKSAKELVLLQHNPPEGEEKIITFPFDRVMTVHKVVGRLRG